MEEENCSLGYIKLFRSLLDWEWFDDSKTLHVFVYCLLRAGYKDATWKGINLKPGEFIGSRAQIAEKTRLTDSEVKTALMHLEKTGEITRKKAGKFTIYKVKNYSFYQQNADISTEKRRQNADISTEKQPKDKKERSKEVKKERKKTIYDACSVIQERYHSPKLIDAWMAFLEMRKLKKKPVSTERALTLLMKDLDRYGQTDDQKIAVLEQSVKNSWQGLYPLKGNDYGPNGSYTYRGAEYHSDYSNDIPWGDEGNV